jgi:hypothetical protein
MKNLIFVPFLLIAAFRPLHAQDFNGLVIKDFFAEKYSYDVNLYNLENSESARNLKILLINIKDFSEGLFGQGEMSKSEFDEKVLGLRPTLSSSILRKIFLKFKLVCIESPNFSCSDLSTEVLFSLGLMEELGVIARSNSYDLREELALNILKKLETSPLVNAEEK